MNATTGLQGTEMWLSIAWLCADLIGITSKDDYKPVGVHRPEPLVDGVRRLGVVD